MNKNNVQINITQKQKKVSVNPWVDTAIDAKKNSAIEKVAPSSASKGKMLQVKMSICKNILYKK